MNQAVWKFEIKMEDKSFLNLPKSSEILTFHVDENSGKPCIWCLVYPENETEERIFELFGTGHEIHNGMGVTRKYIGTCHETPFVWHLFERLD